MTVPFLKVRLQNHFSLLSPASASAPRSSSTRTSSCAGVCLLSQRFSQWTLPQQSQFWQLSLSLSAQASPREVLLTKPQFVNTRKHQRRARGEKHQREPKHSSLKERKPEAQALSRRKGLFTYVACKTLPQLERLNSRACRCGAFACNPLPIGSEECS